MSTSLKCPIDGCTYASEQLEPALAVEMLKMHSVQHTPTPPVASAPTTPNAPHSATKLRKPERPTVDLGISEAQWDFFADEWRIFKLRADTDAAVAKLELRAACSSELRRHLFDFLGQDTLNSCSEEDLLKHIKTLAVQGKNPAVHRQEFYTMYQAPDEPVQQYVAKLQSKAAHCNFSTKCECTKDVSYAVSMVTDQMVTGLHDKDIQGEVLAKDSTLNTFQLRYDYIHSLEEGKRARSNLSARLPPPAPASAVAGASQYQRDKRSKRQQKDQSSQPPKPKGCPGCNSTEHGRGTNRPRAEHCPYWESTCQKCNKKGHVQTVCRGGSPRAPSSEASAIGQSAVSYQYSSALFSLGFNNIDSQPGLPHMAWSPADGCFKPANPKKPHKLQLSVSALPDAHAVAGHPIAAKHVRHIKSAKIEFLADTGAQTCISDPKILDLMGISRHDLIPTNHGLISASQTQLNVLGAVLIQLQSGSRFTKQMLYICDNVQGAYLSESAQIDIGIIPKNYPNTMSHVASNVPDNAINTDTIAPCGCPRRQAPPPIPTNPPFPPTEENQEKIQQWILEYYSASAFNVCPHQPLPVMVGSPLKFHFRPDAEPKAHHTPIPVPHHWKTEVKEQLDADVALGTIERVPPGTPTIWCARMVVVPKKDGTPRRTVDLQALNAATYRETHHTPSPFQSASTVPPNTKKTTLDA